MPIARITKIKQLTERDKNILTDLARCRVLSLNQIKQAYWPNAKERTCVERLARLEKAGYLRSVVAGAEKLGRNLTVYCLGTKGKKWATGPEGPALDKRLVFDHPGKVDEIVHQIRANNVYFRLSEKEKATWKIGDAIEIERDIYRAGGGAEVPDACYEDESGETVYVEADTGSYTARQVREKIACFQEKKTIWVCPAGREKFLARHGAGGEFYTYCFEEVN